nr:hypothetical protein CFP56_16485 [Quercus suber]
MHFALPRYISKRATKNAEPLKFSAGALDPDAPEPRTPTCSRCFVTIANQKKGCKKPKEARCKHCTKGHRSCALIYDNAVAAAGAGARADPEVQRTGLKLARAQKAATTSLQAHRLRAARAGEQVNAATSNPTTSADYLRLMLAEQRTMNTIANKLVRAINLVANELGDVNGSLLAVSSRLTRMLRACYSHGSRLVNSRSARPFALLPPRLCRTSARVSRRVRQSSLRSSSPRPTPLTSRMWRTSMTRRTLADLIRRPMGLMSHELGWYDMRLRRAGLAQVVLMLFA